MEYARYKRGTLKANDCTCTIYKNSAPVLRCQPYASFRCSSLVLSKEAIIIISIKSNDNRSTQYQ